MASVEPPDITYKHSLPAEIIIEAGVSDVQIEDRIYAGQATETLFPDGSRRGHWNGDGTGIGKPFSLVGRYNLFHPKRLSSVSAPNARFRRRNAEKVQLASCHSEFRKARRTRELTRTRRRTAVRLEARNGGRRTTEREESHHAKDDGPPRSTSCTSPAAAPASG
jgi:hypothetical protein